MLTGIKKFCHDAIIWTLIFILGPGSLVGCSNDLFGVNTPVSVSLDKTLIEYDSLSYADSTQVLTAEVLLKGGGTTTDVRWDIEAINGQQSAIQVLSTASGRLQFLIKQAGEYRISAISTVNQELSASCVVRVKGYIESLAIANEEGTAITGTLNTSVGATFTLKALYTPSNTSQTDVRWEVEDDAYLSIDYDTGAAIAKAPGTTTITVRSTANPNVSASITVLVKASTTDQSGAASRMSVSPTTMDIPVQTRMNNSYKLTAYVLDTFGNSVDSVGTVRWESSNTDAVTVTADGTRNAYVNAIADGEADIYAYFIDPRYESSAELSAKAHVTVTGAVTGISTGFDVVSFPTDYDTSDYPEARINVLYMPEDTTQKGFNVSVEDGSLISIVNRTNDSFDIRTNSREGSTTVRIESIMDRSVYDEFTVNVRRMATDAERVSWIELSRNSLVLEPPFDSSMEDVEAYTWVFDEKTGDAVRGDASRFPVSFRADDDSIIRVENLGGNKVRIIPLRSGETRLIATSGINPEATASIPVTVEGRLEGIAIPVDDIVIRLGEEEPRKVEITANPWNALMTTSEGGAGTYMTLRTVPADVLDASLSLSGDSRNRLVVSLAGKMPGTADISILGDGEELGSFSASVIPSDDYVSALSFDKSSIIMKQDSDGERIMLSAEGYDGSPAEIDRNIRYVLLEGANEYEESDFSRSRILDVTVSSSEDSVYVMPKNSGTVILRAYPDGNSLVSTDVRIEVGGSAIKGTELRELRPHSDYMQIRLGQTASAGVNFIPAEYADKSVNWEIRTSDDDTENVRITRRGTEGTIELQGIKPGRDIIYVESSAEPDVNTQFTVEVVDVDAYAITLDRHYLNYDRNRKADPVITATVTKNGSRDTSHRVVWEVQDDEDLITVTERGTGNTQAQVHLNDNDSLGLAYVTATIEGIDNVSATCQVEVIDSTAYDNTPRALNLGYSSLVMTEGDTVKVPYTVIPAAADEDLVFDIQYSVNGIAQVEQDIDGDFIITAEEPGEVDITFTIMDTEVSDELRIYVSEADTSVPTSISLSERSVNLSQEGMDDFVSITADVLDRNGNVLDGLDVSFSAAPSSSRFFSMRTAADDIDTSKNPSDGILYWGNEEITANEARLKPVSAGSSYITVSYEGVPSERILVTVAAEEAIYQEGVSELIPSTDRLVLEKDEEFSVHVTAVPENGEEHSIAWESNDPRVATVMADDGSSDAVIRGISSGNAVIKATLMVDGMPVEAEMAVEVVEDSADMVTGITLLPQHIILDVASKDLTQLTATVFMNGIASSSEEVEWSVDPSLSGVISTDEGIVPGNNVLNISKLGMTGRGYITASSATDPDFTARTLVEAVDSTSLEKHLGDMVLNTQHKTIQVGEEFQIAVAPVPSSIASEPDWTVTYTTSDGDVVSVSEDGLITGMGVGNAYIEITGSYGGRTLTERMDVTVDIVNAVPEYIEVTPSRINLSQEKMDSFESIEAVVIGDDGNRMPDLQVEFTPELNSERYFQSKGFGDEIDISKAPEGDAGFWGSSEIGFNEFRIKPVSAGASRIRVSYPGIPDAYVDVTVAAEEVIYQEGVEELIPSTSKAVVQTGMHYDVWVTAIPENDLQGDISWSSLDDSIASVTADATDSRYARIKGNAEGETTVIASIESGNGTVEARIPVVVADDISQLITGITLLPQHIVLDLDAKDLTVLNATVFRGGEADEGASVAWDVDEALTSSGAITYQENLNPANTMLNISKGADTGSGYITATSVDEEDFYAKAFVEVVRSTQIETELWKVLLNAYSKDLFVGETFQIVASPVPASIGSAADPAWSVSYSSSNEHVATVSDTGLIEAAGIGSAVITVTGFYKDRDVSAAINVTVDSAVPASDIELSKSIVSFSSVSGSENITVALYNENGDEITDEASFDWIVDDPSVASIVPVDENGSEVTVTPLRMDASTRFSVSSGRLAAEGYVIVGEIDELVGLILDPVSIEMAANEKAPFSITPVPGNMADKIEIRAVTGSNMLSVDMENREVSASREGASYVDFSAYDDETGLPLGITARLSVNVNGIARPQRIELDRSRINFSKDGDSVPVSARIISNTGSIYDGEVEWSILNGTVASVSVPDPDDGNSVVVTKAGAGETELRASYGTLRSSISVVNSEKPLSDATKPSALIAANEQIVLYHPDTADAPEEDKKVTLEVYYQPDNLRDEYKGLVWTISGSSIAKADTEPSYTTADGHFDIVAVREGTSTVTARSQADSSVSAEFRITVLPEGVVIEGGIPRISIDRTNIELDINSGSERVSATVTNDEGEVSDYADKLEWESVNDLTAVSDIDERTASLSAKGKAGYDTVKASYLVYEGTDGEEDFYITASVAVRILDTVADEQDIRAITLSDSKLVMLTGTQRQLLYELAPQIPVDIEWICSEQGIVEIDDKDIAHALKPGSVTVTIQATNPETGTTVRDSVDINVTATPLASGKWVSFTPSPSSLSLVPSDSAASIEYELISLETGDVDLSAEISQIRVVGLNGKVLQTITYDQILDAANDSEIHYGADNPNENDLFSINWYGDSTTRLISVDPLKPGAAYLEVTVADDPENIADGAVTARTFVSIGGTLKSFGIQQEYIHLAEGDRQTIELDFNPTNAVINRGDEYFSWTSETDGIISLSDETASSVVVRADKVGQTVLRYIYDEDGDAGSKAPYEAEVVISVDDPETIAGGARMVSFPSSYIEIPYPYERTNAVAKITFFDGTTSTDNIQYRLKNVDPDDTSDSWAQYASIEVAGSTNEDEGVYITPLKAGEVMLEAYYKDATNTDLVASTRLIIRGAVSDIIPSNTSILLYTGGSMILTASPDDASAPGLQYNWRYEEKTMNNGKGEQVPVSGFQSSIITPISGNNTDMSSVIVAARDVQQVEGEAGYSPTLISSYPRKGTLYVSLPEYPGVESEIDVTVELLPAENTYPMDLELSETYLTLEPDDTLGGGFTSDEVMTATVSDRDGNTIDATVDWYYYPISSGYDWTEPAESETTYDADGNVIDVTDAGKMYLFQSWLDPRDTNSNTYIQAYMRENTSSIYYRPKTAGQYRMKAVVRENPVLQAECTINVGGEIRSIAADTGPVVELIKGETENISATYTPENALIRDVFWIPESFKTAALRTNATDDELMKIVNTAPPEGTYTFTQNGPSINVLAKETTDETKLFLEYWSVDVMGELSQAANDMDGLTALEYRNAVMNDDGTVKSPMYSYQITIRINPKDMTTMNFSVEGLDLAIDPSEIDSVISFSVNANASGADTTKTFSNWEWVDVDIVGSETGYVYATTRLIDDPNDLASPEGQKKKVADWELYKSGAIDQPLAINGRIYRNGNTYSFQLNQAGLTIEPLYVTATIQEDVKDGWLNGDGTGETAEEKGEYLFDSDTLAFNQGRKLVHIGGAVGSISPDETYFNLNGTDNQTAPAGTTNIDLILGASARLTVAYSPAYTHQKGVIWYVESGSFTDFQAMPDSSQCSVFGRHETDSAIKLRAVSIYDPWFEKMAEKYDAACGGDGQWLTQYLMKTDVEHRQSVPTAGDTENRWRYPTTAELKSGLYVDFQITVRSPIEKAVFTALSLGRNNSATDSSGLPQAPDYDFLNEKDFPPTEGENEIWCYDLTGASGNIAEEDSRIDAYLVTAKLDPDYDYPLTFELVKGAEIGSLDNRDLDEDSNQFRFVPRGMVKDIVGEGYSINYGDVTIRASNSDLNFSRDFILHYTPSNMKLVKYIGERDRPSDDPAEFGTTVPEEWQREVEFLTGTYEIDTSEDKIPLWDVYVPRGTSASEPTVYGLEALVLYPGERFDLAAISYFNGVPQYASRGVRLNDEDEPIKYAMQFAVKEMPNSSSFKTGYLEFESGYYQDAYGTGNLDDKNPDGSYDADMANDTGVSGWYYDDPSATIIARKQGTFYLQYSLAPVIDPPYDEATGTDPDPYADVSSKMTHGLYVYIVDPVNQVLSEVVDNGPVNAGNLKISTLIPYRISASQLTAVDEDGNPMPSHWFMAERGACIETIVDSEGEEQDGYLYRGRAFASFSVDGVPLTNFNESGQAANIETISGTVDINSKVIPDYSMNKDLDFRNQPSLTDVGFLGDYGLNRFRQIYGCDIEEDGSIVKKYIDDNWSNTIDLSDLNVRFYSHTGLATPGSGHSGGKVGSEIAIIKPPRNAEKLSFANNALNCLFEWSDTVRDGAAYDIRNTLKELDLSGNDFGGLDLIDFTALRKLDVSDNSNLISTVNERVLNVISPNTSPALVWLNADDTVFDRIVAEFRKGTEDEFLSLGYSFDGYPSIFSARTSNPYGASDLEAIELSGAIGYADVSTNKYLKSFIHSSSVAEDNTSLYSYDGGYEDFIQVLNLGGTAYIPDAITEAYGDAYSELGHPSSLFPDRNFEKIGPGLHLNTFRITTVGYLRSNDTDMKNILTFDMGRVRRFGEDPYADEPDDVKDVDFNKISSIDTINIGEVYEGTHAAFNESPSLRNVVAEDMRGTLELSYNTALNETHINQYVAQPPSSTLILDCSELSDLSGINANVNTLQLNDMPNLTEVTIGGRDSNLGKVKKLLANSTVDPMDFSSAERPEGSRIRKLDISSDSDLQWLECWGGGSLEDVNIQGEDIYHIDMHEAGLYGKQWDIGSFHFAPMKPTDNIDSLGSPDLPWGGMAQPEAEYILGMPLSSDTYETFRIYDIRYEQVGLESVSDDSTRPIYNWVFEVEGDLANLVSSDSDSATNRVVDWKKWLPGLQRSDAEMILYGNNINFRYFLGAQSILMSAAYENGIIPEPEFEGRLYKFRMPAAGWLPNEEYNRLAASDQAADQEEYARINRIVGNGYLVGNENVWNSGIGFGWNLFTSYNADDYDARNEYEYSQKRAIQTRYYSAWTMDRIEDELEDQGANYWHTEFIKQDFIDVLNEYFIYVDEGYEFEMHEDIEEFADMENGVWRDFDFQSEDRNDFTEADFSIRFGMIPQEAYESEYGQDVAMLSDKRAIPFAVHNKWKGKAGLTGWFSQDSTGLLAVKSAENAIVESSNKNDTRGDILSSYTTKDGVRTREIWIGPDGSLVELTGFDDLRLPKFGNQVFLKQNGNTVKPDGILVDYHLYDQWTKNASHNGVALIFPFAP